MDGLKTGFFDAQVKFFDRSKFRFTASSKLAFGSDS